jgi:uncharacterized protein (TIGR02453 family)
MAYFDDETFAFLRELRSHNERAWFNENKDRYERSVKEPLLQFIADVGPELKKLSSSLVADPRPVGGSMFRIYRDVRFSKDKSPYKTHAGAHFQSKGGPGYYLHVAPAQCFVAGGMWMPDPAVLEKVRERISKRPADWEKARVVLDDPEDVLKRPPRGFDPDDPMIEDIKRKSFTASVPLSDQQMKRPDLVKTFIRGCKEISPLMKFLAGAAGVRW